VGTEPAGRDVSAGTYPTGGLSLWPRPDRARRSAARRALHTAVRTCWRREPLMCAVESAAGWTTLRRSSAMNARLLANGDKKAGVGAGDEVGEQFAYAGEAFFGREPGQPGEFVG